jgi:hypothetical protein
MCSPNRKKSPGAKDSEMPKVLTAVPDTKIADKKALEALKAKRNQAFAQLVKNPQNTTLALEIKLVDDQIAECVKQSDRKRRTST